MILKKKIIITAILLLAAVFYTGVKIHSQHRYNQLLREVVVAAGIEHEKDFHKQIDALRDFISSHSHHDIYPPHEKLETDNTLILSAMLAHAQNNKERKILMECSTRVAVMADLLRFLGHSVRSTDLFMPWLEHEEDKHPALYSHIMLGVKNPQTEKWETYDPDYNIHFQHKKSGERVSVLRAMLKPDDYTTCDTKHCADEIITAEGLNSARLKLYFSYIGIHNKNEKMRVAFAQTQKDYDEVFTHEGKTGTFCEVRPKSCKNGYYKASVVNIAAFEAQQ